MSREVFEKLPRSQPETFEQAQPSDASRVELPDAQPKPQPIQLVDDSLSINDTSKEEVLKDQSNGSHPQVTANNLEDFFTHVDEIFESKTPLQAKQNRFIQLKKNFRQKFNQLVGRRR